MSAMRVHHIAFRVGDLQRSLDFFVDVLGMVVRKDARPRSVWLDLGDAVLMLEHREAGEPAVPGGSLDLVAFRVDDERKARIRQRCIELGCTDGETEHTVYLRDPDGRRIGVSTYPL